MSKIDLKDLSDFSMLELFRMEVETQSANLTKALLALETEPDPALIDLLDASLDRTTAGAGQKHEPKG
jgi:hypothetical protein